MLFTDVNEQYKIRAHAYVLLDGAQTQCWWLMVIAESSAESTTNTKKNQLLESNWFWTLSFTYSTYFLREHILHIRLVYPFSFFLQ